MISTQVGAIVLLWDAKIVEWYYAALQAGITHLSVNASTAARVIDDLDPTTIERLVQGAKRVQDRLVCPDCIASYLRRVAAAVARRCFGDLLDDAGKLAAVAASVDEACDVFVEVLVQPKKVDGQIQYTKVEAGRRACDVWKDGGSSYL